MYISVRICFIDKITVSEAQISFCYVDSDSRNGNFRTTGFV